jgi:hypothetical protein
MTYTPLTPAEIKTQYDWLVSVDHPKIIKDKKTLDYFLKMENRQEISSAYSASRKAKSNQPGFDPSQTEQEIKFQEKLHSDSITEKSRNRYLSAEAAIKDAKASGEEVTSAMKQELTRARDSVTKMYSMKSITEEIKVIKNLPISELTDRQKEILELYEARKERKSAKGRAAREARGLRSKIASLDSQEFKLSESLDAFVKRMVRDGYEGWLEANPSKFKLDADPNSKTYGKKLTGTAQSQLYWDLLPDWEKEAWYDEVGKIQKHNNEIIQKYHDKEEIVPRKVQINELKQLHHIQPRRGRRPELFGEVRGGHFPAQTAGVEGDAYQARKSLHGLLHDPQLDHIYGLFEKQNYMVFDLNDPNIIRREPSKPGSTKPGEPKINQGGVSYLRDVAESISKLKGGGGGGQRGFVNPRLAGSLAIGSAATLGFMSLLSPGGREAAEAGIEKAKTVGERILRKNPVIMETLNLLGVPQEKMFETIYNLQGQGEWKGGRRIDAGDIVQNAMGQDWMAKNPNLYAGISTASDIFFDPLNVVGGGLLKAGASGLRKLRNIWGN